jgi:hypothetical protein
LFRPAKSRNRPLARTEEQEDIPARSTWFTVVPLRWRVRGPGFNAYTSELLYYCHRLIIQHPWQEINRQMYRIASYRFVKYHGNAVAPLGASHVDSGKNPPRRTPCTTTASVLY